MNKLKKISVLLILALVWISSGCEKDDICDPATATTPLLVIDFYDITNPTLKKKRDQFIGSWRRNGYGASF